VGSPTSESKHIPKTHAKKKAYRAWCKEQAREGRMNQANGLFTNRSGATDNSMKRDYFPQGS
jgi:hypothetical protein